jgi:hypothetical protein
MLRHRLSEVLVAMVSLRLVRAKKGEEDLPLSGSGKKNDVFLV